jgi:hypothetical protein
MMDIKSWSIRKQVLFLIGLTLAQGTIITFIVIVLAYFFDNEITIVQMVLLWIICCLAVSGITFWLSDRITSIEWKK